MTMKAVSALALLAMLSKAGAATTTNTTTSTTTTTRPPSTPLWRTLRISGAANPTDKVIKIGAVVSFPEVSPDQAHSSNSVDVDDDERLCGGLMIRIWTLFFNWLNVERGGLNLHGEWFKVELNVIDGGHSAGLPFSATDAWVPRVVSATTALLQSGHNIFMAPCGDNLPIVMADVLGASSDSVLIASLSQHAAVFAADFPPFPGRSWPNFKAYGVLTPIEQYLDPAFAMMSSRINGQRVVALYENDDMVHHLHTCRSVDRLAKKWGMKYNESSNLINAGLNNITAIDDAVEKVRVVNPDLIIVCGGVATCMSVLKAIKEKALSPQMIITTQCLSADGFIQGLGDAALFVAGVTPWMPSIATTSQLGDWTASRFNLTHYEFFGDTPHPEEAAMFAGAELISLAIERAGSAQPHLIRSELDTGLFETTFGPISFGLSVWGGIRSEQDLKVVQFKVTDTIPRLVWPISASSDNVSFPIPPLDERACFSTTPTWGSKGLNASGSCITCPQVAAFDDVQQKRVCLSCVAGTYPQEIHESTAVGAKERMCLKNCSSGSIAPYNLTAPVMQVVVGGTAGICTECPRGSYQLYGSCVVCPLGRYGNSTGMSECNACPKGKSVNATGSHECTDCPQGKVTSSEGQSRCLICPIGKHADTSDMTECNLCGAGKVARTFGSSSCHDCLAGKYSVWGATNCSECAKGHFQPDSGQDRCKPVPDGAAAPRTGMTFAENEKSYWSYRDWSKNLTTHLTWEPCQYTPDACLEKEKCSQGNTGRQCQICIPGYSRSHAGEPCWKCFPRSVYYVITAVVIIIMSVLSMLLAWLSKRATDRTQDAHSVLLKLLINHLILMNIVRLMYTQVSVSNSTASQDAKDIARRISWTFGGGGDSLPSNHAVWSIECMVSAFITPVQQVLMDALKGATHVEYLSPNMTDHRQAVKDLSNRSELYFCLFWILWPFMIMFTVQSFGFFLIIIKLRRGRAHYKTALDFYAQVYEKDFLSAKKTHMRDGWTGFVYLYSEELFELWWPVRHARVFLQSRMLDMGYFWAECYPVRAAVVFMTYGSAVAGCTRALKCVTLYEGGYVLLFRSEVQCEAVLSNPLFLCPMLGVFIWLLCYPFWQYISLRKARAEIRNADNKKVMYKFSLMINGYKQNMWWWEVVMYLRKASAYVLYAVPFYAWREEARILCFLLMAIFYACLHVFFEPFDQRSNGLLNSIELHHLGIWILCCMMIKFADSSVISDASTIVIPTVIGLLNITFCFRVLREIVISVCISVSSHWSEKQILAKPKSWRKKLKLKILSVPKNRALKQPNITVDHLYGWVSMVGGGVIQGGGVLPPTIPKGVQAAHFENGRPPLSVATQAAFGQGTEDEGAPMYTPGGRARLRIQESIQMVMKHIIQGYGSRPCFSVSVLDFVIRAAFTLDREMGVFNGEDVDVQEVSEIVWQEAILNRDPLKLLSEPEAAVKQPEDHAATSAEDAEAIAKGLKMEEDLTTNGLSVVMDKKQVQKVLKHAQKQEDRANREARGKAIEKVSMVKDLAKKQAQKVLKGALKHENPAHDQVHEKAAAQASALESRNKALRGERLEKRVELMFSPAPFRRGLPFERLQLVLMELERTPRDELQQWMDIFEERWTIEKNKNTSELRQLSGKFAEVATQATDDTPKQDKTEEDLRMLAQMKQDPSDINASELSPEMRWLKLSLHAGRGISCFRLPMLLPVTRKQHECYEKVMQKKMAQIRSDAEKVEELVGRLQRGEIDAASLASDPEVQALLARPSRPPDQIDEDRAAQKKLSKSKPPIEDLRDIPVDVSTVAPNEKLSPS